MKKIAYCLSLLLVLSLQGPATAGEAFEGNDHLCRQLLDAKNYAQAWSACSQAAERGSPAAQFHLSMMYSEGWGVEKSEEASLKWLKASAKRGYPAAEYALASRYAAGSGVPKDRKESIRLLMHAANQGFLLAQMLLGRAYESGYPYLGIDKDMDKAVHWYREAAEQCESCQYELWRIYFFGRGVDKDYAEAAGYLKRAAEAGLAKAQMQLAFRYRTGEGVSKDDVKAYMWFFIAAKGGDPLARKALPHAARKISKLQAAKARTMAERVMERPINTAQLCELYKQFCGPG